MLALTIGVIFLAGASAEFGGYGEHSSQFLAHHSLDDYSYDSYFAPNLEGYGGGGYGGGYGGYGGGLFKKGLYGGHGGYGGGYGGEGGYLGGKDVAFKGHLIKQPIIKLKPWAPTFNLEKFVQPAKVAIPKLYPQFKKVVAPPVYIEKPPITKIIEQPVYVKQPYIVKKVPKIIKSEEVVVKKQQPIEKHVGGPVIKVGEVPIKGVEKGFEKGIGEKGYGGGYEGGLGLEKGKEYGLEKGYEKGKEEGLEKGFEGGALGAGYGNEGYEAASARRGYE